MAVSSSESNGRWVWLVEAKPEETATATKDETPAPETKDETPAPEPKPETMTPSTAVPTATVGTPPVENKTGVREDDIMTMSFADINKQWETISKMMEA